MDFDPEDWDLVKTVPNPWGKVPMTGGGRSLPGRSQQYLDRLRAQTRSADPVSRRHHYVPQSYLRRWSDDGKRVWTLDTVTGQVKHLGTRDVCVQENFYRVIASDGGPHNRVELLFRVVDEEMNRLQTLLEDLSDPDVLEFEDLVALGVTLAIQRMRTAQERRLQVQQGLWLAAQDPSRFSSLDGGASDPFRVEGIHTQLLFSAMWEAADVLISRQIEFWDDPQGRFLTCDAPVLVPFRNGARPHLISTPYILWPVSPHRVLALTNDHAGSKAVMRTANGAQVGLVRDCILQGRERQIFANGTQRGGLPVRKSFRRRPQIRYRCSPIKPDGSPVPHDGCCVEMAIGLSRRPDVSLCSGGLHRDAPGLDALA